MKKVPTASGDYLIILTGICCASHQLDKYSTRPFLRGVWVLGCCSENMAAPKRPYVSIPLKKGVFQAPGDKPSPSKEV